MIKSIDSNAQDMHRPLICQKLISFTEECAVNNFKKSPITPGFYWNKKTTPKFLSNTSKTQVDEPTRSRLYFSLKNCNRSIYTSIFSPTTDIPPKNFSFYVIISLKISLKYSNKY